PACGKEYRTGTIVTLLDSSANAGGRGARVCKPCARGALVVVAPKIAPKVAKAVESAHDHDARWVQSVIRQLRTYAKLAYAEHVRLGPGDDEGAHQLGRAEGYEAAIELLRPAPHLRGSK